MLGCRCGAKWNAAEWVDEAVAARGRAADPGPRRPRARSRAARPSGVEGRDGRRGPSSARAETVVRRGRRHRHAAPPPGLGPARGRPGPDHGHHASWSTASCKEQGIGREPPMTWSYEDTDAGYMLSTLVDPWLLYPIMAGSRAPRHALTWPRWRNDARGDDQAQGRGLGRGLRRTARISKPLTPGDRERLAQAEEVCRRILVRRAPSPSSTLLDAAARHAPERDGPHRDARGHGPRDTGAGPLRLRRQRLPRGSRPADRAHHRRPSPNASRSTWPGRLDARRSSSRASTPTRGSSSARPRRRSSACRALGRAGPAASSSSATTSSAQPWAATRRASSST